MAKYYGSVGYANDTEPNPGVVVEEITTREYYGDVLYNTRRLENSGEVNDDINVSNKISIVADPYALDNFWKIRYATFMGQKWKVKSVDVERPRLILTLGGLYNG
ncbi:MAG: hypothetical protein II038_05500 [Lachnospiraceae bacterium]|nr:hypothetical protein [Lachnospiraceae bacterium]